MGSYFHGETKPLSRTDQLRQLLAELKAEVGKLGHGMSRYALDLLRIFADVDSLMTELLAEGIELEAETTAFTTTEVEAFCVLFLDVIDPLILEVNPMNKLLATTFPDPC